MIDVLGRTPALAQAVSRLLPFLTYGRKAGAMLLADRFIQVRRIPMYSAETFRSP